MAAVSTEPAAAAPEPAAPAPAASAARQAETEPAPSAERRSSREGKPPVQTPKPAAERDRPAVQATAGNRARAERPAPPMPVARSQTAASPAPAAQVPKPVEIQAPAPERATTPEPPEPKTAETEPSPEPERDPTPAELPMNVGKIAAIDAPSAEPSRSAEPSGPAEPPSPAESSPSSASALPVDPALAKTLRDTMKEIDTALSAPPYLTRQDLRTDGKTRTDREMRALRKRTMDARMELIVLMRKLADEPERQSALKTALGTEGCTRIERRIGTLFQGGPGSEDASTALQLWKGPDNE
jgi:hypothetical protein